MTHMMKSRNVATLEELKQASVDLGVNFYACEMSTVILGTTLADFDHFKEVLGVAKFLKLAEGGQVLFI
jgi:peroxiredoxin family protein